MGRTLKKSKFLIFLLTLAVVFSAGVFYFLSFSSHQTRIQPARAQVTAYENLDELEARVARKSINTFYSGENASNYYMWQPQTMIYKDTSTNHEVILWSQTNNAPIMGPRYGDGWEYNWQPWSADGKRIAFFQDKNVGCYTRASSADPWFSARSDGSYWRPMCETSQRTAYAASRLYPDWSPIIPDVAYATGANTDGNSGLDTNGIYREVFTDMSISSTRIVDLIPGDTSTQRHGGLKSRITGDGLYLVEGNYLENEPYYVVQIEPAGSRQLKLSWNLPTLDTYWYSTVQPANGHAHDEGVVGNAAEGYWFYFMPSGSSAWWRIHLWGSDGGVPTHAIDHTSSYDWWVGTPDQTEVQIVGDEYGWTYGNHPAFTTDAWWSHGVFDRWGTYVVYSDVENPIIGPAAMNIATYTRTAINTKDGGTQYHCWQGWSDYFVSSVGAPATKMGATKYNSNNNLDHLTVAELHTSITGDFTNPGQSPDGTKMAMKSDWLTSGSDAGNLFIGVVYFPYPPEITSVSAAAGQVSVRFDWRLSTTPRGYTTRGWPNEDTDDPSPPREIEKFRLWRSSDGINWVPITTLNYDIFSRYNFSNGAWLGNNFWTITDTPGNGTWYYAVTSLEWSGLESRNLSNIYQIAVSSGTGTGLQNTAYPVSPGDLDNISTSDFNTQAPNAPSAFAYTHKKSPATANGQYTIEWTEPVNNSLIRYYNIYAQDSSDPSAIAQDVIASIPKAWCNGACSWVDWLGNTDGSTHYGITAVDYQGNESQIVYPGQTPAPVYLLPDLSKDKAINQSDFDLFKPLWGTIQADFNSDSKTDSKDFGIMMSEWGNY